jgi:ssDNA-binding Zn-finger/Zn-ribbon topoisomerase 1
METKRLLFSQQQTARYLRMIFQQLMARTPHPRCPECEAAMDYESWSRGHVHGCDLFHAMRERKAKPRRKGTGTCRV